MFALKPKNPGVPDWLSWWNIDLGIVRSSPMLGVKDLKK